MSKFVEKTFHSLNSVLNTSRFFPGNEDKLPFLWAVDHNTFVHKLHNAQTKEEEEKIVTMYLTAMEKRVSEPNVSNAEIEKMIKMCMVCETLGYSSSFIYVHSLKLAQKGNLQEKHTGYLAAAYFLHPQHELVILLINTMQKDLCSSNYVEVLLALTSVCNLISAETVHNVLHFVEEKLNHQKSSVRKLAVLALSHCLELANSQSSYQMSFPKLEKALTDHELEVVSVVIPTIYKIIKKLPGDFIYLTDSLVQLQEQILLRRIPQSMIYSKSDIPAPWLQIDILKLLSLLCKNVENPVKVTLVLKKTLQQGLYHNNMIAHAVIYQVIETVATVETSIELKETILSHVSTFLRTKSVNIKLIGLQALILVVKRIKPTVSPEEQEIIMECLTLPDETLQLKTLELMYELANPANVQAICKKMMEFFNQVTDDEKKKQLALKILHLTEKFADKHEWYISSVINIISTAGHVLDSDQINNIITTIMKDDALQITAKSLCTDLCEKRHHFSPPLVKIFASIFSTPAEFEKVFSSLINGADEDAYVCIFISLMEAVLTTRQISTEFINILKNLNIQFESSNEILAQLLKITEHVSDLKEFNPDDEVDPSLTFLDEYVLHSLENITSDESSNLHLPYFSKDKSVSDVRKDNFSIASSEVIDFQPSEGCSMPKSPTYSAFSSPSVSFQSLSGDNDFTSSMTAKKNVWTKEGRKKTIDEGSSKNSAEEEVKKTTDQELLELFAGIS